MYMVVSTCMSADIVVDGGIELTGVPRRELWSDTGHTQWTPEKRWPGRESGLAWSASACPRDQVGHEWKSPMRKPTKPTEKKKQCNHGTLKRRTGNFTRTSSGNETVSNAPNTTVPSLPLLDREQWCVLPHRTLPALWHCTRDTPHDPSTSTHTCKKIIWKSVWDSLEHDQSFHFERSCQWCWLNVSMTQPRVKDQQRTTTLLYNCVAYITYSTQIPYIKAVFKV